MISNSVRRNGSLSAKPLFEKIQQREAPSDPVIQSPTFNGQMSMSQEALCRCFMQCTFVFRNWPRLPLV